MVPSLTASGNLVCAYASMAWLLPPEPSKKRRPHSTLPSVRFSQRLDARSQRAHFQPEGAIGAGSASWTRSAANLDGRICSPSHVPERGAEETLEWKKGGLLNGLYYFESRRWKHAEGHCYARKIAITGSADCLEDPCVP